MIMESSKHLENYLIVHLNLINSLPHHGNNYSLIKKKKQKKKIQREVNLTNELNNMIQSIYTDTTQKQKRYAETIKPKQNKNINKLMKNKTYCINWWMNFSLCANTNTCGRKSCYWMMCIFVFVCFDVLFDFYKKKTSIYLIMMRLKHLFTKQQQQLAKYWKCFNLFCHNNILI